jgi:hypothetical protein
MNFKCFKISKLFLSSLFMATLFCSCEKTEISESVKNDEFEYSEFIELKDNDELLSILNQLDEGKEASEIEQLSGLNSMWNVYERISESYESDQQTLLAKYPNVVTYDSEDELTLNVKDPMLSKVISPEGLIKIGDKIIMVDGETIKAVTNGNFDLIPELAIATNSNESGTIIVEKVVDIMPSINLKSTEDYTWSGTVYSGSKKRVKWEKWGRHYALLGYSSLGAKIKYQEKKALGWFAQKRSLYLRVRCDEFYYGCGGGWCYLDTNIDMSKTETTKSLTVSKHYGQTPAGDIYGLVINFDANGIVAER